MKHDGWKRFIVCIVIVWLGFASVHAWQIETIDAGGNDTGWGISQELDSGGIPHVSTYDMASHELKHVWKSGLGWVDETIDGGGFVVENSIAINGDDFPSVCYSLMNFSDYNDRVLKYASKDGDGWHTETVDENGFCGGYSSLAIDSADNPHLSYYDTEENELRYAWKDVSGWHIEMFDDAGSACYTSLALDDDGYPHVSYSKGGVDEVRYAWKDAAGWHIETFDTVDATSTSLSLDSAGYPHVSYVINSDWYMKYAWKDASGWHSDQITGGCGTDDGCIWDVQSLALDGNDMPHISYCKSGVEDLMYAWKNASGWQTEIVDNIGFVGMFNDLVVDENNIPSICYLEEETSELKYAIWIPKIPVELSDAWHTTIVDGSVSTLAASIALDANDCPHIAYHDYTNGDLKYAWDTCTGWQTEIADSTGNSGKMSSIALDASGNPHISYYDHDRRDLKYAWKDSSGWHTSIVDSDGMVGFYTSIAIDADGNPCISYQHSGLGQLRYAWKDASGWHIDVICSGQSTSLALDSNDNPVIGFIRGDTISYAWKDSSGWHTENVGSARFDMSRISLALTNSDMPCISYYTSDRKLGYAWEDVSGWHVETVDKERGKGFSSSLDLDGDGNPHILYYDSLHANMKYAWKDFTGWNNESITPEGYGGSDLSLALDSAGTPHISYRGHGLEYAWRGNRHPVAKDDEYSTWRNLTLDILAPGVLENDIDPSTNSLEAMLVLGTAHGTVTLHMNGSFVYVPDPGYIGLDSFTYMAYNGELYSPEATVFLKIYDKSIPTPEFPSVQPMLCALVCVAFTVLLLRQKKTKE